MKIKSGGYKKNLGAKKIIGLIKSPKSGNVTGIDGIQIFSG